MTFHIEIQILVNKPHLAALAKSLESQLADMLQQSSIFNSTFLGLVAQPVTLRRIHKLQIEIERYCGSHSNQMNQINIPWIFYFFVGFLSLFFGGRYNMQYMIILYV